MPNRFRTRPEERSPLLGEERPTVDSWIARYHAAKFICIHWYLISMTNSHSLYSAIRITAQRKRMLPLLSGSRSQQNIEPSPFILKYIEPEVPFGLIPRSLLTAAHDWHRC